MKRLIVFITVFLFTSVFPQTLTSSGVLFNPNNIAHYVFNTGITSYYTGGSGSSGFFWPAGTSKTMIFEDGVLWAGKVNGQVRSGGSSYRTGLQPGNVVNGVPSNPADSLYNIWMLSRDSQSLPDSIKVKYDFMYNNWPAALGAPFKDVNHDGIYTKGIDEPGLTGAKTLWYVCNDFDSNKTKYLYGSLPIGIEMQVTEWGYDADAFKDVLFKKVKLINKSANAISEMFIGLWSDPDLGDASDDYIGCDTILNLGYAYNATNTDYIYGVAPPAIGYFMIQSPSVKSLQTDSAYFNGKYNHGYKNTSFYAFPRFAKSTPDYGDPMMGDYLGTTQLYYKMLGLSNNGNAVTDPVNGNAVTKFFLYGDPEKKTGWYEGDGWPSGMSPQDMRFMMSFGPMNISSGDTTEFVFAYVVGQGTSNINSVTVLKDKCSFLKNNMANILTDIKSSGSVQNNKTYSLAQNYPNPFNPTTVISYQLATAGKVTLKIFDVLGKEVTTLVNEEKSAGSYSVKFNAVNLPSGVYFYCLKSGGFVETKKLLLLK